MTTRLTETQREVVEHGDGALLVVAGPGSGKTRVLTERVRRLLASPGEHFRILAVTFTNKAANEMVDRLSDVPGVRERAFVGTLHSFCMEVLANRGKSVGVDGLPHIFESFDDRKQILHDAVRSSPALRAVLQSSRDLREQQNLLSRWLHRIGELKNALIFPEMIEDENERELYEAYDAGLRASSAIDYDDLLVLTFRLFSERPKIAEFYCRQYRYVCVDEAQDLNEAQYRLLRSLCGDHFSNIMAVGDPKQAIYVWNGSDPKYLDMFRLDFGARTIKLRENFRCARAVVEAAKRLDSAYEVEGQLPIEGLVEIIATKDEAEEASAVSSLLLNLAQDGHPDVEGLISFERCAVLGRNRFVFREVEKVFRESGIPHYKKYSSGGLQGESTVMRQLGLALRLLANPSDRLHLDLLLRNWKVITDADRVKSTYRDVGLGALGLIIHVGSLAMTKEAPIVLEAVQAMHWSENDFKLLPALTRIEDYSSNLSDGDRETLLLEIADWKKHWNFFLRSEPGGRHSVGSFLSQVALGTTQQPNEQGVALLTVHTAKGMEFDVVFVIAMNEGTFPDYRAVEGPTLDEEARSAFVAVTRSKRLLYLTYPEVKAMPWGDVRQQRRSRYLDQILGSGVNSSS